MQRGTLQLSLGQNTYYVLCMRRPTYSASYGHKEMPSSSPRVGRVKPLI